MNRPQTDSPTRAANKPACGWRRARLLLPILLCLPGGCAPTHPASQTWRAEAQMMVLSPPPPAPGDPLGVTPSGADASMATQITLIQNREMARRTEAEMKNMALMIGMGSSDTQSLTLDDIHQSIKATNPPGTRLLVITAEAATPTQAKDLANATARAFVGYKRNLATNDMFVTQHNLEREAARAGQAVDAAERRERLFKQAATPSHDGAARLRQNTEIATELYRRLQTALAATKLQRDLVSGDVSITEYADVPKAPS